MYQALFLVFYIYSLKLYKNYKEKNDHHPYFIDEKTESQRN